MLRIGLSGLEQGPVETVGGVPVTDPLFEGIEFALSDAVRVSGQLSFAGPGSYYWRGELATTVAASCRRCLAPVRLPVKAQVDILFTEDPLADDASVYLIPQGTKALDLSEAVREELILAVPEYVVCRDECRGLCPHCGKDLNEGPCQCRPAAADPRWAALLALTERPSDDER
ncbi:MAG: DUF177 domain-containing protein [Gemmatimonadetes bacterium]|nr:DUF177 domain-containing protein [Gemmatimonadota bacterium]